LSEVQYQDLCGHLFKDTYTEQHISIAKFTFSNIRHSLQLHFQMPSFPTSLRFANFV